MFLSTWSGNPVWFQINFLDKFGGLHIGSHLSVILWYCEEKLHGNEAGGQSWAELWCYFLIYLVNLYSNNHSECLVPPGI